MLNELLKVHKAWLQRATPGLGGPIPRRAPPKSNDVLMVLVTGIAQCFSSAVAHVLVGYVPTQALSTSYVSLLSASRHMQEVSFAPSPWRQVCQDSPPQEAIMLGRLNEEPQP